MHPVMDASSPAHTTAKGEMKDWKGMFHPSALEHSPNEILGTERAKDLTKQVLESQKEKLGKMYDDVFRPQR